jgi:hypothetical protein
MRRASLWSVALLFLFAGVLVAQQDKDKQKNTKDNKDQQKATITKVDAKKGTVTVRMKDKDGKEVERTFDLTGEVMLYDDNGKTDRAADIDIFRSGDYVLILEREGKLKEMHKEKKTGDKDKSTTGEKKDKSTGDKKDK